MKSLLIITLALITLTYSCNKGGYTLPNNNSQGHPKLKGYTATDTNGVLIGVIDTTDWTHDSVWLPQEKVLFAEYNSFIESPVPYASIQVFPSYPNPTMGMSYLTVSKDPDVRLKFKIVNKNFNILTTADSIYENTIGFNTLSLASQNDTAVRIYYFFERNDSILYKGHGDIKLN